MNFHKRHRIYLSTGGKCFYCGEDLTGSSWHVEHKVCLVNGGSDDESNLLPSCASCNRIKHGNNYDNFKIVLQGRVETRAIDAIAYVRKIYRFNHNKEVASEIENLLFQVVDLTKELDISFYGEAAVETKDSGQG